ncbi:hypothetical protein B0I72DRAFT_11274 [Yarrowia lipolytica]|uniref:YALI0D18656p n=2 Tax=Yarrowia lipolytica TaxID=4952 RepID=Q6C8L6_YARLI|nr:YALI0D18656p [Yarrowia lipolytica CLIB122]AOW04269.1 hypothetical protein YALI1_D23377g [Yarrowia lipolytica]KAB8281165.1 hypothetical protein BKA91DRAFT_36231 [Yarrowia lipolytica]KAE8170735.1 hypothetical protein BKA90DRAFT_34420 [Yarrowia lipolytica]KAJ8054223.1 hypothetical protein LXG23DRAFT_36326 [Yarrowia lipolytica]RDW30344.1 hypothetical protein B0I72DRAFT_11274 [Yarrowia lipolytica]|eukprot:XP_502996.1 YALI0D18656p [Yarrowia lipolytica CLIB122]
MSPNDSGNEHGIFPPRSQPAPPSTAPTASPSSRFTSLSPYPRPIGDHHSLEQTSFGSSPASANFQGPLSESWPGQFQQSDKFQQSREFQQSASLPGYEAVGHAPAHLVGDAHISGNGRPAHHAPQAPTTVEQKPRLQLLGSGVSITEGGEGVIPQEALFIGDPGFEPFRGVVVKPNNPGDDNHPWGAKYSDHGFERPGGEIGNCVTGYPLARFRQQLQGSELLEQVSQAVREVPRSAQETVSNTTNLPTAAASEAIPRTMFEGPQFPQAPGESRLLLPYEYQRGVQSGIKSGVLDGVPVHGVQNGVPVHGIPIGASPAHPLPPGLPPGLLPPLTHPLQHFPLQPLAPHHLPPQHIPQLHLSQQHLPLQPPFPPHSYYHYGPPHPMEFQPHQVSQHKPPVRPITPDPPILVLETQYGCLVEGPFSDGGCFGLKKKIANPPVPFETPVLKDDDSAIPAETLLK